MKFDLPCDIVTDLLPNYVDGLASDSSTESVEAHLKHCKNCREIYETMRKDYQKPAQRILEDTTETEQEKTLFRKINSRLNQKVRRTACVGIAGAALVAVLFYGLFNIAIKEVPIDDVRITAHMYNMEQMGELVSMEQTGELVSADVLTGEENTQEATVVISKGETEPNQLFSITIPDNPEVSFTVTDALLTDCPYVTVVEFSSQYYVRKIDWDYRDENDKRVMYVSDIRTTLLGNKAETWNNTMTTLEFSKVDKIIYVDDNGNESIMWENEI